MIFIQSKCMTGAAHGCLLRIQIRYTAIFIKSWNKYHYGFQLGLFAPGIFKGEYRCFDFYWYSIPKRWWHREKKYWRDWFALKKGI